MKKNVASQSIGVQMITAADGTAFTGAVSVLVTIDNGTQTAGGGTAPAHEGNGYHSYAPTQAETNGDHIAFTFTGTGAIPATVQVYTSFPQTGDNYTRLGAPAGASVSADVAAVKTDTAAILVDTGTSGVIVATNNDKAGYSISGTKTTLDALNDIAATAIVSGGAITTSGGAVSNVTTCTTNTDMRGTDNALLASSAPTNFSDLAITVTTGQVTVGANNDKTGYTVSTVTDKTGYSISGTITTLDGLNNITAASVWAEATRTLTSGTNIVLAKGVGVTGFNDVSVSDILTTQMTESYSADGVAPSLAQAMFLTMQNLQDFSFSGTTQTVKKLDGTTTAATYTLDDAASPTSKTRTS